jgi:23S rRNA (cytosine1962-C5)-methyltransferase
MAASEERFDVIILDPPALVKRKKEYHAGLRAYQQLNQFALTLLNPNGILFSASCSMHISSKDLLNCIRQASVNAQRELVVLEQLHQDIDHPIHPAIDETNYLKAYILMVTSDR